MMNLTGKVVEYKMLLIMSLVASFIVIFLIHQFLENIEKHDEIVSLSKQLDNINAELVTSKKSLDAAHLAISNSETLILDAVNKQQKVVDGIYSASYIIRNDLEQVAKKLDGNNRLEVEEVRAKLIKELEVVALNLKDILKNQKVASGDVRISLFHEAVAEEELEDKPFNSLYVAIIALSMLLIILVAMIAAIFVFEAEDERAKFARSAVQTIVAFIIGGFGGTKV